MKHFLRLGAYYFQWALEIIFFVGISIPGLIFFTVRWKNPSSAHYFGRLWTLGNKAIFGFKTNIKNEHLLHDTQPCIYVGNHQSNWDVFVHLVTLPKRTIAIGKKEIIWVPIFGILFYLSKSILLDRKNRGRALSGMDLAKEYLQHQNISIYMFPEGTRNHFSHELLPFKKGAFHLAIEAGVPLLPIVTSNFLPLLDEKKRMLKRGTIQIEILEPIPTKGWTVDRIDDLVTLVRNQMQDTFSRLKTD